MILKQSWTYYWLKIVKITIYITLMLNSMISSLRDVCSIYIATGLFGDTESD